MCATHYKRTIKNQPINAPVRVVKVCASPNCENTIYTAKKLPLCKRHEHRREHGNIDGIRIPPVTRKCAFKECSKKTRTHDLCVAHYRQERFGKPLKALKIPTGKYISNSGYVLIYKPDSPMASKQGWAMEHRFLMAEKIDRPLFKDENVHHINGVRSDNRLSNLELWSSSQPSGQRVVDKVKYAKEILLRYEGLSL